MYVTSSHLFFLLHNALLFGSLYPWTTDDSPAWTKLTISAPGPTSSFQFLSPRLTSLPLEVSALFLCFVKMTIIPIKRPHADTAEGIILMYYPRVLLMRGNTECYIRVHSYQRTGY